VTGRQVLAAADVGSNTVHALVAAVEEGQLADLASYLEMPELGAAVDRTGRIGPEKTAEALAALRSVLDRSRAHDPELVVVGATAAVRRAADCEEFLAAASAAIGKPVRLIGEEREAQLSFLGVASRHGTRRPWLMGDMGGGSTELVAAEGRRMLGWVSLRAGSGALAARYLSDPPDPGEREALRQAALAEVRRAPACEADRLVMTGGTASYLPLALSTERPPQVLTTEALLAAVDRLDAAPAATLAERLGVPAARVRALRAGAELLLLLLDFYGLDRFHVSHAGLRQGMILAWLERGDDWWR
jgi:exopolyphosphatase/guanosine-5'-triphosphate,3'-diphosphate pyrophosphatase